MLSVIVPIFNEEKYIEHCIQYILEQDYPKDDLEVLFVDGMCNDSTRSIVSSDGQYVCFDTVHTGVRSLSVMKI